MLGSSQKLTRIGVFYDGNFFSHVSNYYYYFHSRKQRISIAGLHNFIKWKVADDEAVDARFCQIVDAHYFRGRFRAQDMTPEKALKERSFEDILIGEGVTTHYLPLNAEGSEKGIDVWLALEAYELAIHKRFDVIALVASDGDFLPLVRKLNSLGTRVMLLGWDLDYTDKLGKERSTRTSQVLIDEASYPVLMHTLIDDRSKKSEQAINGLFVERTEAHRSAPSPEILSGPQIGKVISLFPTYGFVRLDNDEDLDINGLFFYYKDVEGVEFRDLKLGDPVEFSVGTNDRGPCARAVRPVR